MYDVAVDDDAHLYYSNGIVSHNTTVAAGYILHELIFNKSFTVAILANKGAQAREIMERLRHVIDNYQHADEPGLCVSLSIGLATCRPELLQASTWLNEADKALYIAKNTGRNKISVGAADTLAESQLSNDPV